MRAVGALFGSCQEYREDELRIKLTLLSPWGLILPNCPRRLASVCLCRSLALRFAYICLPFPVIGLGWPSNVVPLIGQKDLA